VDRETVFSSERLDRPARVFVDLQRTRALDSLRDAVIPLAGGVVQRIRVGRHPGELTRVVLDLTGAGRHSVYSLYNPYRVVIDLELPPGSAAVRPLPLPVPPPTTLPAPTVQAPPPILPTRTPLTRTWTLARAQGPSIGAQSSSAAVDQGPMLNAQGSTEETKEAALAPTTAAKTGRGDYSLSRQLGLGIARIAIDAGHGGHDPGAKVRGLTEADLVLDIAQRLEQLLRAQPGVEVVQTRRSDVYVSLEERTEIANRAGADLFVSIHANASTNPKTRGVETYVLNFAPNPEAEAIAARENAGSTRTMRQLPDIVKAIALNNKVDESRELARFVQDSLHVQLKKGDPTLRNLGVKQAPFMVLVGATMPAILTEVAFVTNQQDAPRLRSAAYRQAVAAAILRGITRYQQSLKKAASRVAAQQ
ncbi:MAG TPA: N-acetylmuramoyl-L-alanine amidase, partial [Vicinamibacterales bacterium]